jgi:drug/metabolite transporter (DMT)-like permease
MAQLRTMQSTIPTTRTFRVTRRAPIAGVALVAAGAALWGVDGALRAPLVATGSASWSSWTIVLYEHVILVAIVTPLLIRRRHQLRTLDRSGWLSALCVAWGGSALATLAFTEAFRAGNPDVVVLLQKTQPLWAIAAAVLVVRERPRPDLALYVIPAAVGAYLLSFGGSWPAEAVSGAHGRVVLLALTAAALWGAATAFGRRALRQIDAPMLAAVRFSLAVPLLAVIAAERGSMAPPAAAPAGDWLRLLLIALGPGLVAMLLYYRGLHRTPAPVATFAELAFPATALVVNYVFLGATIDRWQFAGLALLWATIAVLHRAPVSVAADREHR